MGHFLDGNLAKKHFVLVVMTGNPILDGILRRAGAFWCVLPSEMKGFAA